MKLTDRLQRDYEIYGRDLSYKHKVFLKKPDGSEFEVPNDWFWVLKQTDKVDRELVVSASKILTHASCLKLAREWALDLSKAEVKLIVEPTNDNENRAAFLMTIPNCVSVVGEASPSSLNSNMKSYIVTMAHKRGMDKLVTHATGIYTQGFYSQSELGGSFVDMAVEGGEEEEKPKAGPTGHVKVGSRKYDF